MGASARQGGGRAGRAVPEPHARGAWVVVALLCGAVVGLPAAFTVLVADGGSGGVAEPASASPASAGRGSTDRAARVTFHLRDGAVGMRMLRDAPPVTQLARGHELMLVCGYRGGDGLTLLRRPLRWASGAVTARVALAPAVLASIDFCAVKRGPSTVARAVFG